MRILHTVEFYHPAIGGAERVVQRISEGLVARGHEVVVATSHDPRRDNTVLGGVQIASFKVTGNHVRSMRGEVAGYQAWIGRERFDVVMNYAAQAWPTDAALPVLRRIGGAKVLATCGFSGMYGVRRLVYASYFRMLAKRIREYDALVYHTATGADAAFGHRYGGGEQVVIPNGVDAREFGTADSGFRDRHGIQSRYMLLHVGNHYRIKGHRDLMLIPNLVRGLDVTLVVIGDDAGGARSCWAACSRAARRDSGVSLLSGVPRQEVVAAFSEADLLLLTSGFEVAPLVLVEAMAAGVPFVSYDVGNARELAGGLVVAGRKAMGGAVRVLLEDQDQRRALSRAGRAQARGLEWETIIDRYEALYAGIVDRKRSA